MNGRVCTASRTLAVIVMSSLVSVSAGGQGLTPRRDATVAPASRAWTPSRTADGQPDLQGIWLNSGITPLERPKALEGKAQLTDEEVAELKKRVARIFDVNGNSDFAGGDEVFLAALANGERHTNPNGTGSPVTMAEREWDNRTSLIVDPPNGRIPPLTPEAQKRRASTLADAQRSPAGPEDLSNMVRCLTFGVPRLGGNAASYNNYYQIVQTPGYVVMVGEAIHDARIIPLDGRPHLPSRIRQWRGDSLGRWEGNTLVVDTTNFSSKTNFLGAAEHLHLIERFTRVSGDEVKYEITLDDSTTWTRPWTAVVRLKKTPEKMFEYACHEGNYAVIHGILAGAQSQETAGGAGETRAK